MKFKNLSVLAAGGALLVVGWLGFNSAAKQNAKPVEPIAHASTSDVAAAEPARRSPAAMPSPSQVPVDVPPPVASAPAIVSASLSAQHNDLMARIEFLEKCYEADCDFPRSDAKSYDFAVGLEIKTVLTELSLKLQDENVVDAKISDVARQELANEDGHVKEAALHLIATQPTSRENLQALLDHVVKGYDALLIGHAMLELTRYNQPAEIALIQTTLAEQLIIGAPYVSMAIAENISPFINPTSYSYFAQVGGRLAPNSTTRNSLESSLTNFRRKQTGA